MKTKIYLRFKWLLLCCFLLLSVNMMAGGTNYWYKVTATASPTGEGKVYVSDEQETPKSDYKDEMSIEHKENSSQQAASKEFYLFAQPAEIPKTRPRFLADFYVNKHQFICFAKKCIPYL